MQNLVRVRVADAAEQSRIGERSLECVILQRELCAERIGCRVERLDAASIERAKRGLALYRVQRCAARSARFCQKQRSRRKTEARQHGARWTLLSRCAPAEPSRDHEVDDEKELIAEAEHDAFPDAAHTGHMPTLVFGDGWSHGAQHEGSFDARVFQRLPAHPWRKLLEIDRDIGEFWHRRMADASLS